MIPKQDYNLSTQAIPKKYQQDISSFYCLII